jgi:filamentous hemagglutinin family protein
MRSEPGTIGRGTMTRRWLVGAAVWVCVVVAAGVAAAQITLDGSLGPRQTLAGPNVVIGAELGQVRGRNLFHSFEQFNVRTSESATFTGPAGIGNILSRVTGSTPSTIDGRLASTIPGANLFLLNPSGVIFGPQATLDVSGSFHVSTADFLRLADGGVFHAGLARPSLLTVAPPAAFGFLGANPAGISVSRSELAVPEGQTLSLVGGDVAIAGGSLSAPTGRVAVMSVASPGEVGFVPASQAPTLDVGTGRRLGRIELSRGATLETTGLAGGGTVVIRGGRLTATGRSTVRDINPTDGDSPPVGVDVRLGEEIVLDGSRFQTASGGAGRGGDVVLGAPRVTLRNGAQAGTFSFAGGAGGDVRVTATEALTLAGETTEVLSRGLGTGPGGALRLSAPTLIIDGANVQARGTGGGRGGDVVLDAGRLALTGGALVQANAESSGPGGDVSVTATESISLSGRSSLDLGSAILSSGETGPAGRVSVAAPVLDVDAGAIASLSAGDARAGDVVLRTGRTLLRNGSFVTSSNLADGPSGDLTIVGSESVTIGGRRTLVSSTTDGTGQPGTVRVSTPALTLAGGILGAPAAGTGRPGDIVVEAANVVLTDGGSIVTFTLGQGRGGTITIAATESVTVAGQDVEANRSAISAGTAGRGGGGRIAISTPRLVVDGGSITATTSGEGRGGDVGLDVGSLTLRNAGDVGSNAILAGRAPITGGAPIAATGPAGTVRVTAADAVALSGEFTSINVFTDNAASGGRIAIAAPTLTLSDRAVIFATTAGAGRAGEIAVDVGRLTLEGGGIIDSSTLASGPGGTVAVSARDLVLITGRDPAGVSSRLSSNAGSGRVPDPTGPGGDIVLRAPRILLSDGGQLAARSFNVANSGNIRVEAADTLRLAEGAITTDALQGEGGNIDLRVGRLLHLVDSQVTTSVQTGIGGGGNITIDPRFVVLDRSAIQANAFGGPGGNVRISADVFLATDSVVTASSALGVPGVVDVQAPITDVSGSLAPLPEAVLQAVSLLRTACRTRLAEAGTSSFVLAGRGGLAPEPGGLLPSPLAEETVPPAPAPSPLGFVPLRIVSVCP